MQTNTVAQRFFEKNGHVKFWLKQGTKLAPTLTNVAITDAILPFATTYLAENAFSVVTQLKTKTRNRLQLHNDLRLAVTSLEPNIKCFCEQAQAQGSH